MTPTTAANKIDVIDAPVLQVQDLKKSFGKLEVLKGVSLDAQRGDVVAIIGSSGSGKSTFIRCLNFLETPDSGQVSLWGETINVQRDRKGSPSVSEAKLRHLRSRIGMVFQSFNLWSHMTILDNLIQAPIHVHGKSRHEATQTARAYLEKVGIPDKELRYPAELSGGQQQRAAIARALCVEPEVLLFDEPTSALDPELVGEVLRVITLLAEEGRTMLIVTHEMAFARDVSSRTIFLDRGLVAEQGPSKQLFANPTTDRLKQFLQQ